MGREPGYWPLLDEAAAVAKVAPVGQVARLVAASLSAVVLLS